MKVSKIQECDTVKLSDGRIGIVIEIASNGNMMLEKRQRYYFENDFLGDSPIINTNASQVLQIIHKTTNWCFDKRYSNGIIRHGVFPENV